MSTIKYQINFAESDCIWSRDQDGEAISVMQFVSHAEALVWLEINVDQLMDAEYSVVAVKAN